MAELQASRTLVKSGPELWAECSDAASLAKHLGEFGEIAITKLEPENTVAWEGDAVRGTVKLEPAGWGTRVTLTAFVESPAPEDTAEGQGTGPDSDAIEPPPVAAPAPDRPAPDPAPQAVEPEPEPDPEPDPESFETPEPPARQGFLRRLFGGRHRFSPPEDPAPAAVLDPPAAALDPPVASLPEPEPEPVARAEFEPEPTPEPEPAAPAPEAAVLFSALDSLGTAHRRPFSRS